jgi:pimeloyl-ACP methyl ester carboxylesterase
MMVTSQVFEHAQVHLNGIEIHTVSVGEGPVVVFCHGFPESWYSWRHQLPAIAAAGFRAVALDMRGYGDTSAPAGVSAYTISHLVGDVVGVVASSGAEQATVVGHDWGAMIAWYCAVMRPDVFTSVVALSVPPFLPSPTDLPGDTTLNDAMRSEAAGRQYYRLYFQEPWAETDLEADTQRSLLGLLYTLSGDVITDGVRTENWDGYFPVGQGFVDQLTIPDKLPRWLKADDLAFYVSQFSRTGFRGGLNWYRNINAIPGALAPFAGRILRQPALYLTGEHDLIAGNSPDRLASLPELVPGLRNMRILPGVGHWIQQERPETVTKEIIAFLGSLR